MLLHLRQVLNADELRQAQKILAEADWVDGDATAGTQSRAVKNNAQLPTRGEPCRALREIVLGALERHAVFFSAALPKKILPPLFNRYAAPGQRYGAHVDGAILHGGGQRVRADLSCTVFLAEPADYDGGELVVEHLYGREAVKLPAGDALLYTGGSLHEVRPVTRGARLASFFWIESLVRDDAQRRLLHDLDQTLMALRTREHGNGGESAEAVRLTGTYHNLLRMWADT